MLKERKNFTCTEKVKTSSDSQCYTAVHFCKCCLGTQFPHVVTWKETSYNRYPSDYRYSVLSRGQSKPCLH